MDDRLQIINDPQQAMRSMLEGRQVSMWTAIPGIILSVDLAAMTCEVQVAIKSVVIDANGTQREVEIPPLPDVPICFPRGGGFLITMPLAPGDEVLVVFASRCIDAWWQSGGVQQAMEARMHDLSDAFAIPGPFSQPAASSLGAPGTDDLQIRNEAGTTYVSITADGKVKLISPSEIDIQAPSVKITGNTVVTGPLACGALTAASIGTSGGGSATIGGSLSAAEVTAGGIPLSSHKHTGVQTGGGTSGGPTP